jgi:hypothetical protein
MVEAIRVTTRAEREEALARGLGTSSSSPRATSSSTS